MTGTWSDFRCSFNCLPNLLISLLSIQPIKEKENEDYVEKNKERRVAHTIAQQRRRNSIKHGTEQLQALILGCQPGEENSNDVFTKQSKAQVLRKSIEYVSY